MRLILIRVVSILSAMILVACEETRRLDAPYENYWKTGFYGHGRALIGDLNLNYYGVARRCDSCHGDAGKHHGELGTCNRCHQPHDDGWSQSIVATEHDHVLPLVGNEYHGGLACLSCHQGINSQVQFKITSCNHCHNHTPSDLKYCHELMDEYETLNFSNNQGCIDCHILGGRKNKQYFLNGDAL